MSNNLRFKQFTGLRKCNKSKIICVSRSSRNIIFMQRGNGLDIKLFNLGHIADNIHVGAFHVENSCVSATRIRCAWSRARIARIAGIPLMYTEHDVPPIVSRG